MPEVGQTARVTLAGSTGVDHTAPLEDLCQEVYRVARKHAEVHGFKNFVHHGPHGPRTGLRGEMVLSRIMHELFPSMSKADFGLIGQVLRKTDACVCLRRPRPESNETPTWFISDTMPENLVVVALSHAKKTGQNGNVSTSTFDEDKYMTRRERQVTTQEAGEAQPPGEVTVKQRDRTAPLRPFLEARSRTRERAKQRVLEELLTSPLPLTAAEIAEIINRDPEYDFSTSTYQDMLNELAGLDKVSYRKETTSERLVRGGGKHPKGASMRLYVAGLGPVPERTELPAGIAPRRAAKDWADEQKAEFDRDANLILGALLSRGRSTGILCEMTGLTKERFDVVLQTLIRRKQVVENNYKYYRSDKQRAVTPVNQPTETPASPVPDTPEAVTVEPSAPTGDDGDLALVMRLADKLGVQLPKGDADRVAELERENEKLRGQVAALRAAIAVLE